jgi:hypothetical protein
MPGHAGGVVDIVLHGRYFSEPATVQFMVAVEPNADNRLLRIEADSTDLFRASEMTLSGAGEKRLHTVIFKNLPAGYYTVRAEVRSTSAVRGMATREVVVTGAGLQ